MKPPSFHHACLVTAECPYCLSEMKDGNYAAEGTLHIGRVVWLEHPLQESPKHQKTRAYIEGVGIIQVDPSVLKPNH